MIRLAENARLDDNFWRLLLVVGAFVLISCSCLKCTGVV